MKAKGILIIFLVLFSSFSGLVFLGGIKDAEAYTVPSGHQVLVTHFLKVSGYDTVDDNWSVVGSNPVYDYDEDTSYIECINGATLNRAVYFSDVENLPANATSIQSVYLWYTSRKVSGVSNFLVNVQLWDGGEWDVANGWSQPITTYQNLSDLHDDVDMGYSSVSVINNVQVRVTVSGVTGSGRVSTVVLVVQAWETIEVSISSTHFYLNVYAKTNDAYNRAMPNVTAMLWDGASYLPVKELVDYTDPGAFSNGFTESFSWYNYTIDGMGIDASNINGTRLRFRAQYIGTVQDALYISYAELMVVRGFTISILNVTTFSAGEVDWGETGSSPYLTTVDNSSYVVTASPITTEYESAWEFTDLPFYVPPELSLLDGENIDDAGADWVFTDWRYYTFQLTVPGVLGTLTEAAIKFTVPTGANGMVETGFDTDGSEWVMGSSLTEENRFGQPVNVKAGTWILATNYTVTFPVWFNDQVLDVWEDGVDVYCWLNFTETGAIDWFLLAENVFRIYSKGGFTMGFSTTNVSMANKMVGEEWAALYAYEGETVSNEVWFRDLQHIKMLPTIQAYAGYETYYIRTTVEYSLGEGEWLTGWRNMLNIQFYSYTGIFAANVWVNMTSIWSRGYRPNTGDYEPMTTDNVHMFYHGSVTGAGDIGKFRFWNDQWFNTINASSTGGGRINAYEFPMVDNADLWLRWLANNWGVKDNVAKESNYMTDLRDADGNIVSSERIKMVRVICELEVADADAGQLVVISDFDVLDYTRSPDLPLTGVQTPVFDETKMPVVGNTGVLGAIFSMFSGIGQWLSENVIFGGLNLWGNFVAFLDTIAGWLGAPGFFTNLFAWIGDSIGYLTSSITYSLQIVWDIFSLFGSLLATFLTTIGQLIASLLSTLTFFVNMMGGAYGNVGNIWNQLGISNWLIVAMVFYPLYLVYLWENEGMDAVVSQLSMIFGILVWLFNFFLLLGNSIMGLITGLIESIPVAE